MITKRRRFQGKFTVTNNAMLRNESGMVSVVLHLTDTSLLRKQMRGTTPDSFLSPGKSILDYNLELLRRQPKVMLVFLSFLVSSCITYFCFIDVLHFMH